MGSKINHIQGRILLEININVTSVFKPPVFMIDTNTGSPSTLITRLTIRVIMAVFRN